MMLTKPTVIASFAVVLLAVCLTCGAQIPFPLSNPVVGSNSSFGTLPGRAGAGDFNGDGREDVVGVFPPNTMSLLLTSPGGGYAAPVPMFTAPNQTTITAPQVVADVTNDGVADIIASYGSGFPPFTPPATTVLHPGLGTGSLGLPIPVPAPAFNALSHACFLAPSIPGVTVPGGPPALVLFALQNQTAQPGMIFVLAYANGTYTVVSSMIAPTIPVLTTAGLYTLKAAGDCDGDGLLDLVGTGGPLGLFTHVVLFKGTSSPPYFTAPTAIPTPVALQPGPGILLADATNDGLADLVAVKTPASGAPNVEIAVIPGHPTAPFASSLVSNIGVPVHQAWAQDLDDDGAVDLLVVTAPPSGSSVYGVAISRGSGLGGFSTAMTLPSSPQTSSNVYALADENGDGRKDAVACAASGSSTFVLYDQTRIGPGVPGQSGVPRTTVGVATPGNGGFFVGVNAAAFNASAVLGVSLAVLPFPDAFGNMLELSPGALLLPSGGIGFFQTDPLGSVVWPVSLPPPPVLVGQIVFLEWAIADAVSSSGFSVTSARKIVFW